MARRSDHDRSELRELILAEAQRHMSDVGLSRFSSREVAKRIGYSVGTIYNVFPDLDALVVAVNTRTFERWTDALRARLAATDDDRIAALVDGYFSFAHAWPRLWHAIYAHELAPGAVLPDADRDVRGRLTGVVADEVAVAIGSSDPAVVEPLVRSLVAVVHGHCSLELSGSYALMGADDARQAALARVREALVSHRPL